MSASSLRLSAAAALLATATADLPAVTLRQKSTGERTFRESSSGRELFFHGVNAIVKGFPYVPETKEFDIDTSLSEKDHATLADLGVNVYRLGSMWKGVEPVRGVYNETYLQVLGEIIDSAATHGIYTYLDMHQDDLSEKFCGEGVPDWAALPQLTSEDEAFPAPVDTPYVAVSSIDGYPTRQDCAKQNWPTYYNAKATGSAFEALYTNVDGVLDSWGEFWAKLASEFGGRGAVLGYELINEPWAGDTVANPGLYIPSVADKKLLQPAYDKLAQAIRKVDNDTLIMFAAVTWDDPIPAGFDHAPGGPGEEFSSKSVFTYHYYTPPQFSLSGYFHTRLNDAIRLQTGHMLTEFERSTERGDDYATDPYISVANAADELLVSWSMWEYKTFCKETDETLASDSQAAAFGSCKTGFGSHLIWDDNGVQNMDASKKLARTYARAVAGTTDTMKFDAISGDFHMKFAIDTSINAPTEIFAHAALQYPDGVKVAVKPTASLSWAVEGNVIKFYSLPNTTNGEIIDIFISKVTI